MRKIRHIWKALLVFFAVAMFTLAPVGCGKGKEGAPSEHPSEEHPSEEHPSEEHPAGEHPE